MPKSKFAEMASNLRKNGPPVDWLRAIILERRIAYRYDLKTLAEVTNLSYGELRKQNMNPPADWTPKYRDAVCEALGIEAEVSVSTSSKIKTVRVRAKGSEGWVEYQI